MEEERPIPIEEVLGEEAKKYIEARNGLWPQAVRSRAMLTSGLNETAFYEMQPYQIDIISAFARSVELENDPHVNKGTLAQFINDLNIVIEQKLELVQSSRLKMPPGHERVLREIRADFEKIDLDSGRSTQKIRGRLGVAVRGLGYRGDMLELGAYFRNNFLKEATVKRKNET